MKYKVDEQLVSRITNLNTNDDFRTLTEYLRDRLGEALHEGATTHDEVVSRWMQGRVQELMGLVNLIDGARATLEKFRNKQHTGGM